MKEQDIGPARKKGEGDGSGENKGNFADGCHLAQEQDGTDQQDGQGKQGFGHIVDRPQVFCRCQQHGHRPEQHGADQIKRGEFLYPAAEGLFNGAGNSGITGKENGQPAENYGKEKTEADNQRPGRQGPVAGHLVHQRRQDNNARAENRTDHQTAE